MESTVVAVDLAKSVFQLSFANRAGRVLQRKRLSRPQFEKRIANSASTRIVMEACATAHHWARVAHAAGHEAVLLPPHHVRPYVRRNKTDAADADAIVRAANDPSLHPVPVKSEDLQALQAIVRIRRQYQETRRERINMARGLLAEFGVALPRGARGIVPRLRQVVGGVPTRLRPALDEVISEIADLEDRIGALDRELKSIAQERDDTARLVSIPGVGALTATAFVGAVPDIASFRRARQFSSWLGLTPREHSSGNARRLGSISRRGNVHLRTSLVHGARSALLAANRLEHAGKPLSSLQRWALELQRRSGHNKASVALANRMARIIWALWTRAEHYDVAR
jgi:transposase